MGVEAWVTNELETTVESQGPDIVLVPWIALCLLARLHMHLSYGCWLQTTCKMHGLSPDSPWSDGIQISQRACAVSLRLMATDRVVCCCWGLAGTVDLARVLAAALDLVIGNPGIDNRTADKSKAWPLKNTVGKQAWWWFFLVLVVAGRFFCGSWVVSSLGLDGILKNRVVGVGSVVSEMHKCPHMPICAMMPV